MAQHQEVASLPWRRYKSAEKVQPVRYNFAMGPLLGRAPVDAVLRVEGYAPKPPEPSKRARAHATVGPAWASTRALAAVQQATLGLRGQDLLCVRPALVYSRLLIPWCVRRRTCWVQPPVPSLSAAQSWASGSTGEALESWCSKLCNVQVANQRGAELQFAGGSLAWPGFGLPGSPASTAGMVASGGLAITLDEAATSAPVEPGAGLGVGVEAAAEGREVPIRCGLVRRGWCGLCRHSMHSRKSVLRAAVPSPARRSLCALCIELLAQAWLSSAALRQGSTRLPLWRLA